MIELNSLKPLALIIEDDAEQVSIFSEALRLAEYETEIAQDGALALARLAEIVPALILLDLHLPQVSGREILRQIRASDRLANTQVIITTAAPSTADMIRHEADLVLIKPISFIQLRDLAARLRPPDTVYPA
ncbi:MAG: response regulator [Anaerolineaceae bacterium]|nr:response regulator [Anaerolineaceae bacterium]MCB9099016.1 response regulator [Anaerolineales bacterium]